MLSQRLSAVIALITYLYIFSSCPEVQNYKFQYWPLKSKNVLWSEISLPLVKSWISRPRHDLDILVTADTNSGEKKKKESFVPTQWKERESKNECVDREKFIDPYNQSCLYRLTVSMKLSLTLNGELKVNSTSTVQPYFWKMYSNYKYNIKAAVSHVSFD